MRARLSRHAPPRLHRPDRAREASRRVGARAHRRPAATRDGGVALRRSVRAAAQAEVSHRRWRRRSWRATVVVAGPVLGIVGAGAISPMTNLITTGTNLYRARKTLIVPGPEGRTLRTRLADVDRVKMELLDGELALRVPVVPAKQTALALGSESRDRHAHRRGRRARGRRAPPAVELGRRQRGAGAARRRHRRAGGHSRRAVLAQPRATCATGARRAGATRDVGRRSSAFPSPRVSPSRWRRTRRASGARSRESSTSSRRRGSRPRRSPRSRTTCSSRHRWMRSSRGCAPRGRSSGRGALAEPLARELHDQLRGTVQPQPRGVDAQVIVGQVAPVALPVPLHVLLALMVLLRDDPLRLFR